MRSKFIMALVVMYSGVIKPAAASCRVHADILKPLKQQVYTEEQQKAREAVVLAKTDQEYGKAYKEAQRVGVNDVLSWGSSYPERLNAALYKQDARMVQLLVLNKADVNAIPFGRHPLEAAYSAPVAKLLLDARAHPENSPDWLKCRVTTSLLFTADFEVAPELVVLFAHHGSSPTATYRDGGDNALQSFIAQNRTKASIMNVKNPQAKKIERVVRYMVGVGVPIENPFAECPDMSADIKGRFQQHIDSAVSARTGAEQALREKLMEMHGAVPGFNLPPPLCAIVAGYADPFRDLCDRELQAALEVDAKADAAAGAGEGR